METPNENMYHEEKEIDGVLCHRSDPKGEFVPYSQKALTRMYLAARREAEALREKLRVTRYVTPIDSKRGE